MADSGANLTVTASVRPSIFEVIAQENLDATIQPAVKHIAQVLATNYPEKFGWLVKNWDETFLIFNLVLQSHYLYTHNSSLAESFYGLERVPMTRQTFAASVGFLVVFPYVRHKAEHLYEQWKYDQRNNKIHKVFLAVYPFLHSSWEIAMLTHWLAYLFGKSSHHSLLLKWAGVELCYDSEEKSNRLQQNLLRLFVWQSWNSIPRIVNSAGHSASHIVLWALEGSVFFLKCLEWWFGSDKKTPSLDALPVPAVPNVDNSILGRCPICRLTRHNDVVLGTSGYVFCYACILQHIKDNGKCPVTGYPSTADHIIRLYPPVE